jgi:hypothetical protein
MIARIGTPWSIAAMLYLCLVMNAPILVSRPAYWPLLRGWITSASGAVIELGDSPLSQVSERAQKMIDHESTQLCMRAFRVVRRQGGLYHKWLIIEDTARAQFRSVAYSASGYRPTKDMKATIDRDDVWNALNSLRDAARIAERGSFHPLTADSIDAAIAQEQTERQNRSSQAMPATSVPKGDERTGTGKGAKPMISMVRGLEPSEEELQRMIDEVWDFAGAMHLEWRAGVRTPAGHKCEVLTFDGSEKVLVHRTFVESPSQSK